MTTPTNQPTVGKISRPTYHFRGDELHFTMEREQFNSCFYKAMIPTDDSNAAKWGREMMEYIHAIYTEHLEKTGRCSIHVHQRFYDGEPV